MLWARFACCRHLSFALVVLAETGTMAMGCRGDMQNHASRNTAISHTRDLSSFFEKTNSHELIVPMHLFQLNLIVFLWGWCSVRVALIS